MKLIRFRFPVTAETSGLSIRSADRQLSIQVFTTFREAPLTLTADGLSAGDAIDLLIHPWRIELWAGGYLTDEEWPAGDLLLDKADVSSLVSAGLQLTVDPMADDRAYHRFCAPDFSTDCGISANDDVPAVIGKLDSRSGENPAEGWKPADRGGFVGDCMPYSDTDPDGAERYHVLYLKDRRHHHSKWGKGAHQWGHLSTRDFLHWELHPLAVSIDRATEGSICTGSRLKTADGISYLYYTVRQTDASPAPILRSVSDDGYHFRRDASFRIELSDRYDGPSARDPKIIQLTDGFHMFVTTSLKTGDFTERGCLAHLFSEDGTQWLERDPIYISPDSDQPECSDYFIKDGWYYLIFSHRGVAQYRFSRAPLDGWQAPPSPAIPCESVPKMALWHDRILFCGFRRIEGYAGTLTFTEAWQQPDGTLRFEKN